MLLKKSGAFSSGHLSEWTLRCNGAAIRRPGSHTHTESNLESYKKLSAAEVGGKLNCGLLGITMIL